MTDTLEPPVQTQPTVDPQKVQPSGEQSSFSQRMAEAREAASQEAGRHPESESEEEREVNDQREKRVQSRQEASKTKPAPKPTNEVKTQQKAPEPKEKGQEEKKAENPFEILNKLKTEGLGETKSDGPPAPAGSTEQAIVTWKQMNAARDQALAESKAAKEALDAAKKELENAKQVGTPEEVSALKTELEQLRNEVAQSDVRKSKDFIENVSAPIKTILSELQATAKTWNIPWNQMVDAMETGERGKRNSALSKLLSEAHQSGATENDEPTPMDEISRLEVVSAVNEFIQRDDYGNKLLADAAKVKEVLTQKEKQAEAQKKAESEAQFSTIADKVFEHMAEVIPQLKTDPEFAKLVRGAASLKEDSHVVRAMKDFYMASAERMIEDYRSEGKVKDSKIAELEEQIKQLSAASPEVDGAEQEKGGAADNDTRSLSERVAELRRKQGQ